jgi:histidinol-phosphate aminotransferase
MTNRKGDPKGKALRPAVVDALDYVRRDIRTLEGYVPGEQQTGFIKLNTNECPFPPSPRVREVLAAIADDTLRLYPDPASARLRALAAARTGTRP